MRGLILKTTQKHLWSMWCHKLVRTTMTWRFLSSFDWNKKIYIWCHELETFLFLQLQRLPIIHSSPANLIIAIHSTMAFRKLTWTKYSAYKILWLVFRYKNIKIWTHYTNTQKNYIGFQSNNASITNCVFLHIKRFKFSNLPIFTIVFLLLLTLCQDHPIHRFCPSNMSEHLWVKGLFLSLLQDSGTPSHQTPVTRYLFPHSALNSKPIFSS